MESPQSPAVESGALLDRIKSTAEDMSGWLKFLGVLNIIMGIPSLIVLVGALYIWLGVLLYQAGSAAESHRTEKLDRMMKKLKTYFIVTGLLAIIGLLCMIGWFAIMGFGIISALSG